MAYLCVECGLTEKEFWALTPGKLSAIVQARKDRTKREDYRAGIITATVRAALGAKHVDVFDDFPEYKTEKPKQQNELGGYLRALMDRQKQKPLKD